MQRTDDLRIANIDPLMAPRLLMTMAAPPSEIWQQSSKRSGEQISRDCITSAREIGSRL